MAKIPYSFNQGDLVTVKGMAGEHKINYMVRIPIPSIIKFKFEMVDREMAKFTYGKEQFCAWASDITKVERKGKKETAL